MATGSDTRLYAPRSESNNMYTANSETWKRVKEKLLSQADGELDENILDVI